MAEVITNPKLVTRAVDLRTEAAGVAAEMRVAAELCRHGFRVARPYWTEDEVDLLVAWEVGKEIVFVPIQVKCVQFEIATKSTPDPTYFIQKLKKRYVERNKWLCLALYNPRDDSFWFIPGSDNIRTAYSNQESWHKHRSYTELSDDDDVRIGLSREGRDDFDKLWKCPESAAIWWSQKIAGIAKAIANQHDKVAEIKAAMGW